MQQGGDHKKFSFPKEERICSKKTLEALLRNKQLLFVHPFKCYYLFSPFKEGDPIVQMAIAVPKRTIKNAVSRNRIKRMAKEVYRLQSKQILSPIINEKKRNLTLLFVFVGVQIPLYNLIEEKIIMLLSQVVNKR